MINTANTDRYIASDEILGCGSFGKVIKAHDEMTGSPCVAKVNLHDTPDEARNEATALQNLKGTHAIGLRASFPGLPRTLGSIPTELKTDLYYTIIMDRANGQGLDQIQNKTMKEVISIWKQLLEYLVSLEERNLVHYDLKPANLFWDKASRKLTVLDHGSVRTINIPYPDEPITTESYEAPELILSKRYIGPSIFIENHAYDMWTVGCIIYELIVGKRLFPELDEKILESNPDASEEHIKMQQFVHQIGVPSKEYLSKCPRDTQEDFFNDDLSLKETYDLPKTLNWQQAISATCQKNHPHSLFTNQLIKLLSGMLCYENRGKTGELLKDIIFKEEITVHFFCDRQRPCKLYLHRAIELPKPLEELTPADLPKMDLTIDLKTYKHDTLHVPSCEKYVLFLESPSGLVKELITLSEGQLLDISQLQATLDAPTRTVRTILFDETAEPKEKKSKL